MSITYPHKNSSRLIHKRDQLTYAYEILSYGYTESHPIKLLSVQLEIVKLTITFYVKNVCS
jgi:hypothetical protein